MSVTITQGADRTIRVSDITDAAGAPLDVTGWAVHATLRNSTVSGPVIAEWHTTPTGDQLDATATGTEVTLAIPADVSAAWVWARGVIHAEIKEPGVDGRTERILDEIAYLDREAVTP